MRIVLVALGALLLSLGTAQAQSKEKPAGPAIVDGAKVRLEYTVKDGAGKVIDSSKGKDPLIFTQGQHQIIAGLEKAVGGMRLGERKKVTVKPEDAYGVLDPKAQTEVAKETIPQGNLKVGARLTWRAPSGETRAARVKEIREKTVVIDLNHPLAGKTLHFDVKVVSVEPPKK